MLYKFPSIQTERTINKINQLPPPPLKTGNKVKAIAAVNINTCISGDNSL